MPKTGHKQVAFLVLVTILFFGKTTLSQNLVDSTGFTWRILEVADPSIETKIHFIPSPEIINNASGFSWDFGDGTPTSNESNPSHSFDITTDPDTIFDVVLTYTIGTTNFTISKSIPTNSAFFWIGYDPELDTLATFKRVIRSGFLFPSNENINDEIIQAIGAMRFEWEIDGVVKDTFEIDETHRHYPNIYYTFTTGGQHTIKLKTYNVNLPANFIEYTQQIVILPSFATKEKFENIPNVFTPNGDMVNDFFKVATSGTSRLSFMVFNRSGQMVYQQESNVLLWDGKNQYGHELSEGVYYFIIQDLDGKYETAKGFVYIFRGKK